MTYLDKSIRVYKELSKESLQYEDDKKLLTAAAEVIKNLGIDDPKEVLPELVLHLHKGAVAQGWR